MRRRFNAIIFHLAARPGRKLFDALLCGGQQYDKRISISRCKFLHDGDICKQLIPGYTFQHFKLNTF